MEELIIKMVVCLLVALVLGFLFGWFIKRAFAKEKYEPRIEELELNCARDKNLIEETEHETKLIKSQFLTIKDELETSSLKIDQLEDHFTGAQKEISMLQSTIKEKELHFQEQIEVNDGLNAKLSYVEVELDTKTKETKSQVQEIARVKEHHTLLQETITKLSHERDTKTTELDKLSIMIDGYKLNETKLLGEHTTYKNQLTELKTTLNGKNIAALELTQKVKEIDVLNLTNSKLSRILKEVEERESNYKSSLEKLKKRIEKNENITTQEVDNVIKKESSEGFFTKLEHSMKDNVSSKLNAYSKTSSGEGFNFMEFAKKTLKKMTVSSEEIKKRGDKAIQEYKDKSS